MAKKVYKQIVPKPASANEHGSDVRLYTADEVISAEEGDWQDTVMKQMVENGWAQEVKMEDLSDLEAGEPVRARNEKGHYIADDPSTPDVNEAYEGGKAPVKKAAKKTTAKKTTKKSTKKTTKK
tara:strand:+ start:220 stop:591 length:372 start_codon:yes stop_codon:yes gene_type:complete